MSRAETWKYSAASPTAESTVYHLAEELVDLRIDLIVTVSPTAIKPALDAAETIPIVMGFSTDPVRNGFITSLAKPGGNITGVVVRPKIYSQVSE